MKPQTRSFYEQAVQRAVEHVWMNLDRALDLQALAKVAALSPFHFHRIFRGMLGETPLELHRRLRMERAAWSLLNSDQAVTDLAFDAGYDTHESFTRAFRARYNCSPTEFRLSRRPDGTDCVRPYQVELASHSGIHFSAERTALPDWHVSQGGQTMDVDIKDMQEIRTATVRHVGPYNRISDAFAKLGEKAAAGNLFGPHAAMLAIYYDDPEATPPTELRSDAAIVIAPDAVVPEGLGELRLPAGRYAHTTHVGPYEQLGDAWARFMGGWLPRSGHRIGEGPSYEMYRNTPGDVPKEKLITELFIHLAS